jgi:hypothetical protein
MKIEKKLEIIFSDILKFETDTTYFLNPSVHASKTFVKVEIHNRWTALTWTTSRKWKFHDTRREN